MDSLKSIWRDDEYLFIFRLEFIESILHIFTLLQLVPKLPQRSLFTLEILQTNI